MGRASAERLQDALTPSPHNRLHAKREDIVVVLSTKSSRPGANDVTTRLPSVRLSDVLAGLSHALDLTEGQPEGHCVRCAWIGAHLGRELGLDAATAIGLHYTLLLKDLGCSSNAARICDLYLTDDRTFKRDFKLVDGSLSAALRFVLTQTGPAAGLSERFRAIVNILQNGGEIVDELIETRCHRGADIAGKMRFSRAVQDGILSLDEHWDGKGRPHALEGAAIPLFSRIALLAQVADVFHSARGPKAAMDELRARSGSWFDPALVEAFAAVQARPGFWEGLEIAVVDDILDVLSTDASATLDRCELDEDYLDEIASAFADVVDAKSPFTAGHSDRVMLFADMIAEEMGFDAAHRRWLRRAALLHDVGKLGVSNSILDKPGKPTDAEWDAIRMHPVHGRRILERTIIFADLGPVAGSHHEKLDGRGYPDRLTGEEIGLNTRIVTVADVFDALSAERPYRAAMPIPRALAIMDEDAGTAFDPQCLTALKRALVKMDMVPEAA